MRAYCGTAFGGESIEGAPTEHWSELYVDLMPETPADEEFLRNLGVAYNVPNRLLSLRSSDVRDGATRFSLVLEARGRQGTAPDG